LKPIISWKALVERFRIQAREPVRALGAAMSESWERGEKRRRGKPIDIGGMKRWSRLSPELIKDDCRINEF